MITQEILLAIVIFYNHTGDFRANFLDEMIKTTAVNGLRTNRIRKLVFVIFHCQKIITYMLCKTYLS